MKNDEYWQEIEAHIAFAEETPNNEMLWKWLEQFQLAAHRSLNARSLILLKALMENMYSVGYAKGVANTEYNDTGGT